MQLISLQIHNFRGIRDFATPIEFHEYTLLVGANNSGKSTVIDAIRAFYEKGYKFDPERDFPAGDVTDDESWLELKYALTDEEHSSLPDEYKNQDKILWVRKYFKTNRTNSEDRSLAGNIYAYDSYGQLADKMFYATKTVQLGKFGNVIYIPAVSKIDDAIKLTSSSPLKEIIADVLSESISQNPQYSDFREKITQLSTSSFDEQSNDAPANKVRDAIDKSLQGWGMSVNFQLKTPSPEEMIKSMLDVKVVDNATKTLYEPDQFGSGFQRHLIYSLISLRAQLEKPTKKSVAKDFLPQLTLLLFEEPEAFLHPQQQELLARELRKLAQNGTFQVVCSTHSTNFVSRQTDDITAIVRMQKNSQGYVRRHQITENQWKNILQQNINTLQNIQDVFKNIPDSKVKLLVRTDDYQTEMEEIKNFMFLNPERSSIFFANSVLLVEGYSEYVLIQRLFADSHISQGDSGFFALECMGKYKLLSFMRLLDALGIPHAVIHDDDQRNNSEPNTPLYNAAHAKVNQMITDAQTPHTKKIHMFSPDLEKFLKISHPGSDQRKPQHILYLYAQGQIKVDRLNEFCQIVNDCIAATRV
jgi:predicted ATP-dependent endonuclease of OLD family